VCEEDDSLANNLGRELIAHRWLQLTSILGLSNPWVAKDWICSSIATVGSRMVSGTGTCAGSILSSTTSIDLDLNTTSVLVRM
jgi:hypothetical protein